MTGPALHPLVAQYLADFDRVATALSPVSRATLREEIEAHLRDAIPARADDRMAAAEMADFGSPTEIVAQALAESEDSHPRQQRRPSGGRAGLIVAGVLVTLLAVLALLPPLLNSQAPPSAAPTSPATPITSVVNANPSGPKRVAEGTAYFEYQAAIDAMPTPLPPGAEYPAGVPAGLDSGETADGGVLESGGGTNLAYFTWLCAWESEYLAAHEESADERRVAAEAMITQWPTMAFGEEAVDWTGWVQNVVDPMKFGKPTGVKADRLQSCRQAAISVVETS